MVPNKHGLVVFFLLYSVLLRCALLNTYLMLFWDCLQDYIDTHPEMVVLDPLPAIRTLLDRCKSYQLIRRLEDCMKGIETGLPPKVHTQTDMHTDARTHAHACTHTNYHKSP